MMAPCRPGSPAHQRRNQQRNPRRISGEVPARTAPPPHSPTPRDHVQSNACNAAREPPAAHGEKHHVKRLLEMEGLTCVTATWSKPMPRTPTGRGRTRHSRPACTRTEPVRFPGTTQRQKSLTLPGEANASGKRTSRYASASRGEVSAHCTECWYNRAAMAWPMRVEGDRGEPGRFDLTRLSSQTLTRPSSQN